MTDYNLTLSTTEANSVGVVKLRHADTNSQVLKVQVIENGLKKSFKGLTPFFCLMAREVTGQGVSEELVTVFDSEKGTLEYTSSDNALQMIGRNEAYFSFRKQSGDTWIEQFSTRSFHYIVEKSIYSQPFKDSNYWWTFKELYEKFIGYQESGRESWEDFVNANKEILESIDPGGEILSRLIDNTSLKEASAKLLSEFYLKLRKNEGVSITFMGDSIIYGSDFNSTDKRPPSTILTDSGETHTATRASTTMTEAVEKYINQVYSNVTIENKGYSGDGTKKGYHHWKVSNGDLIIMNYGINDASNVNTGYMGDIKEYTLWYRKLIERELLNGTPVILISPTKQKPLVTDSYRTDVDVYAQVVKLLSKEYNLPVIDGSMLMKNYQSELYSDATHFNGEGYDVLGARVTASLIGRGINQPFCVSDGSFQGVVPFYHSSILRGVPLANSPYYPTAQEMEIGKGVAAYLEEGKKIYFSFYSEENDLVVLPSLFSSSDSFKIRMSLDFGVSQAGYGDAMKVGRQEVTSESFPLANSSVEIGKDSLSKNGVLSVYNSKNSLKFPRLHIPCTGWHTVELEVIEGYSTVYGLNFINYNQMKQSSYSESIIDPVNGVTNFYPIGSFIFKRNNEVEIQASFDTIPKERPVTLFNLPEGYRPRMNLNIITALSSSTLGGYGIVSIKQSGAVDLVYTSIDVSWCNINTKFSL